MAFSNMKWIPEYGKNENNIGKSVLVLDFILAQFDQIITHDCTH